MIHEKELKKLRTIFSLIFLISLGIISITLYIFTGIFQYKNIDDRDLKYWNYTEEKVIINTEEFILDGKEEVCWLMIHSYASTPGEMRELATKVNNELGDKVYAPRLLGHGEVPSKLLSLELNDWYKQIEEDYLEMVSKCDKINVVGSSFGAILSLKLAEDYDLNRIFLMNLYLSSGPIKDKLIDIFSDSFVYLKKRKLANINNIEGLRKHVAYWNFALIPVKHSKEFIDNVDKSLIKVEEDVLLIHSTKDSVSDLKSVIKVKDKIGSKNFEIIVFDESNHILLADYNKEETIEGIMFSSPEPILIQSYSEENVIKGILEFEKLKRV
ncbi:MAG: hypothetical protein AABW89_00125 [Nanoarchaeota archaeon]